MKTTPIIVAVIASLGCQTATPFNTINVPTAKIRNCQQRTIGLAKYALTSNATSIRLEAAAQSRLPMRQQVLKLKSRLDQMHQLNEDGEIFERKWSPYVL